MKHLGIGQMAATGTHEILVLSQEPARGMLRCCDMKHRLSDARETTVSMKKIYDATSLNKSSH